MLQIKHYCIGKSFLVHNFRYYRYMAITKIVKCLIDAKNIVTHADDSDSEFECEIY